MDAVNPYKFKVPQFKSQEKISRFILPLDQTLIVITHNDIVSIFIIIIHFLNGFDENRNLTNVKYK